MKKIRIPILAVAAILFVGCEPCQHYWHTSVVSITGEPVKVPASKHGKVKPYGSVKLFLSKEEVKQPYEVIDQLAVGGNVSDEGKFIRAFEYHAADLGGDGVIFYRGTPMGQDNSYRGEVIRFK